jgi:hypothetical protein
MSLPDTLQSTRPSVNCEAANPENADGARSPITSEYGGPAMTLWPSYWFDRDEFPLCDL